MNYDFSKLKQNIENVKDWIKKEYSTIKAGRANPSILDSVQVEIYGSMLPVNQTSSVNVEDARTLKITPWDATNLKSIERAIVEADLDLSVSDNGESIRISFPELTTERREQLVKILKDKMEDAKITLRKHRDEVWSDIQEKEQESEISEDEKYIFKEEMEKIIENGNKELEEVMEKKEEEVRK